MCKFYITGTNFWILGTQNSDESVSYLIKSIDLTHLEKKVCLDLAKLTDASFNGNTCLIEAGEKPFKTWYNSITINNKFRFYIETVISFSRRSS